MYRRHTAGGQPCDGLASRPGGVAILLGLLHATETGISSGRVGLWLVCAFSYLCSGQVATTYHLSPASALRNLMVTE